MVFVSRFGRCSVRNRRILCSGLEFMSCLFKNVSFVSYIIALMPSVNGFAELPATLVSELGCHVGINFK